MQIQQFRLLCLLNISFKIFKRLSNKIVKVSQRTIKLSRHFLFARTIYYTRCDDFYMKSFMSYTQRNKLDLFSGFGFLSVITHIFLLTCYILLCVWTYTVIKYSPLIFNNWSNLGHSQRIVQAARYRATQLHVVFLVPFLSSSPFPHLLLRPPPPTAVPAVSPRRPPPPRGRG